MRTRGLAVMWAVVVLVVWCGFFDVLITRGTKEYQMRQALHEAGQGPPAEMAAIMRQTAHDAAISSTLFAAPVLTAAALTLWLARRTRK